MPGSRGQTVLDDLPEPIVVEEILARLPSKDVLRCRAVRKSWRSATSAPEFVVAHRRRQPALPLINIFPKVPECYYAENGDYYHCLVAFRVVAGADRKLWPVVCTGRTADMLLVEAACDGILVVSVGMDIDEKDYFICNPATRQNAPLLQLPRCPSVIVAGFYRHHPSQEFRVLYWMASEDMDQLQVNYNVLAVAAGSESDDPRSVYNYNYREKTFQSPWPAMPRSVDQALRSGLLISSCSPPVFNSGNLHWDMGRRYEVPTDIMVFDTVAETCRWMRRPASSSHRAWMLEVDGALAMCSTADGVHLDFSVMQDYEAELWTFKLRVNLSAVTARRPGLPGNCNYPRVVMVNDRELLVDLDGHLLHCDIDGNFLASVESKDADYLGVTSSANGCLGGDELWLTSHLLQETIFPIPSIQMMQEQDGVSKPWPFILAS